MTVTVFLIQLLVLAVIFVNGWTDAPNAIATAVGSLGGQCHTEGSQV